MAVQQERDTGAPRLANLRRLGCVGCVVSDPIPVGAAGLVWQ